MAVIERFGGCCHGRKLSHAEKTLQRGACRLQWVVRKRGKSRIKTVTEALPSLQTRRSKR